jgi:hypothetical protein
MSADNQIEQDLQAMGKTAPRVTPADIEAAIVSEHYFTAEGGARSGLAYAGPATHPLGLSPSQLMPPALSLLTFCVLVLRNGFTVTGESACVSPENFDAEIGRRIARQKAIDKVWMLEGYLLRERLHRETLPYQDRVRAEHVELLQRGAALAAFIDGNEAFDTLDRAEQERMRLQLDTMERYAYILAKRIAAFE